MRLKHSANSHRTLLSMATVAGSLVIASGCSILPFANTDAADKEPGFQKSVAPAGNLVARPVELADDIEAILNPPPVSPKPEAVPTEVAANAERDVAGVPEPEKTPEVQEEQTEVIAEEQKPDEKKSEEKSEEKKTVSKIGKGKRLLYKVRSGDTLMKIAFEKYGNLYRWRQIFEDNRDRLTSWNKISIGMTLVLNGVEYVVIERQGKPYLIRKGDSLVKISNKVYGSSQHWRALWANNPQLIQDPNKIYAGFTLYYDSLNKANLRLPSSAPKVKPQSR